MSALLRPLSAQGRGRRLVPFAAGTLAGLAFLAVDDPQSGRAAAAQLAAIGVAALVTFAVVLVPWERLPAALECAPAFGIVVAVDLVVAGSDARSVYTPLVTVPLVWFAIYAGRSALAVAIAAADTFLLGGLLVARGPVESGALRAAVLWSIVVTVVPWTVHRIVRDLRHRAALADRDYVTELLSRRAWEERLPDELSRARRDQKPLSIVLFDLDDFKRYNDRHGHQAGDALLRQVALAWGENLRSTDLLARFGGDEYCALLPGCSAADARLRAERLLASTPPGIGASAGVAEWREGEAAESLVRRADRALYQAKSGGGLDAAVAAAPA